MEKKASGINPEPTEVETAMEDIIDRFEEAEKEQQQIDEEKHKRLAEETQQAEKMRESHLKAFKSPENENGQITILVSQVQLLHQESKPISTNRNSERRTCTTKS
eukprot:gene13312-14685_t